MNADPIWWQIFLFHGIFIFLFLFLILLLLRINQKRKQLKTELGIQKTETKKLAEIDQLKSRFFANLSHEFRTILTLITGPLEVIKKNIEQEVIRQNLPLRPYEQIKRKLSQEAARKNLQIIQNNAQLLKRLVNQLLDLSKLDTGRLALKTRPVEIVSVLRHIVHSFTISAHNKNIEIMFQSAQEVLFVYLLLMITVRCGHTSVVVWSKIFR